MCAEAGDKLLVVAIQGPNCCPLCAHNPPPTHNLTSALPAFATASAQSLMEKEGVASCRALGTWHRNATWWCVCWCWRREGGRHAVQHTHKGERGMGSRVQSRRDTCCVTNKL